MNDPYQPKTPSGKNKNTAAKRRIRLLMMVFVCFLFWAGLTLWDQYEKISAKATQLEVLSHSLEETREQNARFQLQVIRLNDIEYIEQKVRKEYGYTRNGETLFYSPEHPPKQ
jgi:cell division protein DivIC